MSLSYQREKSFQKIPEDFATGPIAWSWTTWPPLSQLLANENWIIMFEWDQTWFIPASNTGVHCAHCCPPSSTKKEEGENVVVCKTYHLWKVWPHRTSQDSTKMAPCHLGCWGRPKIWLSRISPCGVYKGGKIRLEYKVKDYLPLLMSSILPTWR